MSERWPEIPYPAFAATGATLHQWLQIAGKYRLAHAPWLNHSWHATFYVTARGLTSSVIHCGDKSLELDFDFIHHQLRMLASDGGSRHVALEPMSVAEFHGRFCEGLEALGFEASFHGTPNEMPDPVPFEANQQPGAYEAERVERYWRALLQVDRVLKRFRTGFLGKVSPVHLFWGSMDMAVTRFSGRPAPLHPGGFPALPDAITREAYSHEVSSAGFWAGGGGIDFPAFYSYAYPLPEGFAEREVEPEQAYFDSALGEFLLPYDAVRTAPDPDARLLRFLQSSYEAAADGAGWERARLEAPLGREGLPRAL